MKMVYLNNKYKFLTIALLFILSNVQAQNLEKINLTIIIDNKIVTSGVELHFISENDTIISSDNYYVGKEITFDKSWIKKNVFLSFMYIGKLNDEIKYYNYKIDLSEGYLSGTRFAIIRIYNLDKPQFKEAYCKSKGDYVVEMETQSFVQQVIQCEKFVKF